MFTNFIIIIIAILVYSVQFPDEKPQHPWPVYLAGFLFYYCLYAYIVLKSLKKGVESLEAFGAPGPWQRGVFLRDQQRSSLLALVFYALLLYSLGFKAILDFLPSETLRSVLGIAPFFLFLTVLWLTSHPIYKILFSSQQSRAGYLLSQVRFNIPVILPWLLATFCLDLAFVLPKEIHSALLAHEWTQLILYAFFFLFLGIFFPPLIKTIWGCRAIDDPYILDLLDGLFKDTGVKVKRAIMWPVMEAQVITAGVMGIVSRFRYVLLTPSIIKILSREELKSVLAHELGHTKKYHLHFYLFFFMGYAIISFLYPDLFFWFLYLGNIIGYFPDFFLNGNRKIITIIFFTPMLGILVLYFRYLFGFFSRNFEREADLFSLGVIGDSAPLVGALDKVALVNGIDRNQHSWHHYGIKERVDFLLDCEEQGELISGHYKRVFYYKIFYLLGFILLTGLLIFSQNNSPKESIKLSLMEGALLKMEETKGNDPEYHLLLAHFRLEQKNYPAVVESYRKVLELDPQNVTALNNLAWLLVTCEDKAMLNYKEGLESAKKAVAIKKEAYILDTLAESYFVNGMVEKAIKTEEEALSLEAGDKKHYEEQLRKFRGIQRR